MISASSGSMDLCLVPTSSAEIPSETMVMMPGAGAAASDYEGHGITYYPGTLNADEAQAVTVGLAEEAHASFAMVAARMTKISGIVRSSSGKPVSNVMLSIRTRSGNGFGMRSGPGMGPDGSFSIGKRPAWRTLARGHAACRRGGCRGRVGRRHGRWQRHHGLVITTSPGATISGQVIFEGTSSPKPPASC